MISARLLPDLSTLIGEADASRLRNKGYKIIKKKNEYILDRLSSLYLLEKGRFEIFIDGEKKGFDFLWRKLTEEEKWQYVAYKGLRDLGYKPYLNKDNIFLNRKRVNVRYYKDIINLSELSVGYFAVVDSDYEPIFYQIKRRNPLLLEIVRKTYSEIGQSENKHNKLVVKSGSKFGCDYRIYRNNELHSSLLVNIAKEDDCKSIVARARIAHSVRKILIYCFEHGGKNKCISIEWIR
jgi:tRNA splicing endonuclease